MATAPKKTAAVTPAATAFDAPAPAAVEAPVPAFSASLTEAAKAFEAPVASLTELQGNLRSVVEKGLSETRAAYAKAKTAADEASNAFESSYAAAKAGVGRDQRQGPRGPARQRRRQPRFRQIRFRGQERRGLRRFAQRIYAQADRCDHRSDQGNRRARAEVRHRNGRADQGTGRQDLQDRGLTIPFAKRRASSLAPLRCAAPSRGGALLRGSSRVERFAAWANR